MAKDQTLKIIDMQSFIGGEADNPYMGPKNCCAKAVGVDLRSKPGLVQLEKDLELVKKYSNDITCIINVQDLGVDRTEDWILYRNGNTCSLNVGFSDTDAYTFPEHNYPTLYYSMALNEGEGDRWVYFYGRELVGWDSSTGIPNYRVHIYRCKSDRNGTPSDFYSPTSTTNNFHKYFETFGNGRIFTMNINAKIYIACGNAVYTQDDNEMLFSELELPLGETIVGMTEYLGTIKIYSIVGNDTYMYTWDGVDYLPTTRQVWKGIKLVGSGGDEGLGVVNDGAYDYVLSESGDLYVVAGTQRQKIRTNPDFSYLLQMYNDILYIGGNGIVYTYCTKYPGIDKSLLSSYAYDSRPLLMNRSLIVFSDESVMRIGQESHNVTHSITRTEWKDGDITEIHREIVGGYIQTMFYTIDQWKNMAFEMMKMKVDTQGYCTVLILYRTSISGNWRLFKRIDRNYDDEKITISIREFNENDPGEFTGIQFMFVLERDNFFGYKTTTPEIGRCTAFLREIDENI